MPENIQQDTNVQVLQNGDKIKHVNEQSQVFKAEDYVDVYNDTVQNLFQMRKQLENLEEQTAEILDQHSEAMETVHTIIEDEEQEDTELEPNSLTSNHFQKYQELQQKKEQREQMQQQVARIEEQLDSMRGAVERVAEEDDIVEIEDLEEDEPESTELNTE